MTQGRAARASAVFLAALLCGCGGEGAGPSRQFLSIGTAGTGGIYYPLGGALASLLSVGDSLRQFTAEVTGGSVENVNRVREGQIDLGFALSLSAYEAFNGGTDYPEAFEDLRVVAPLYPNVVHVLVPRGSDASSLGDLAGGRVSVGAAGSGTEQVARQILEAYGLTYDDVDARFLTFSESAASLRDGAIDAAIISVGYPAAAVLEATTTGGARLLPMESDRTAALRERYPYYSQGVIPAGAYPGVLAEIPTVAMMNWVVSRADLDEEVVVNLLNIIRDQRAVLEQVHEMAGQIDLATLRGAPIPLHGATLAWLGM
ncbi:TAXI family TRAP transporter solute-binding subunit [Gemmatimonadota bacterium]